MQYVPKSSQINNVPICMEIGNASSTNMAPSLLGSVSGVCYLCFLLNSLNNAIS